MHQDAALLERITEIENEFIPLPDGCRLAARIWLPKDAAATAVPAILEYIPYRKRDFMRSRDEPIHRYFAAHGYAAVRVDVRGSGDSDGLLQDEYSAEELNDALAVIAWIAEQPWCNGRVGMQGISWGGFNALQVAAQRPPALQAVITLCASDDRYSDDAHYMGGCLLNENLQWGSILTLYSALPPDPAIVGERWRQMWQQRLDGLKPFAAEWMRHPHRDAYWRHGSVCEDFAAIQCPVYAIGGWADGYSNAVARLLQGLSCPRKGLIGPWAHTFPHDGIPGPSIGFLQEALRWWDHWLQDRDTGIMSEPMLRAWMQESIAPQPQYAEWPGRWVAEPSWPGPGIEHRHWWLQPGILARQAEDNADEPVVLSFTSPQTTGVRSGEWCAFGADGEMPRDQRPDDGGSLTFDTGPLAERIELLGAPVLELEICSDQPVAMLTARLCDVAPDGSSLRISYGLLNLCHRDGHAQPEPLEPGRWYRIRLQLNDLGHALPAGHRLRLGLSSSYWPIAWPAPAPVLLSVRTGNSRLTLPVRPPQAADADLPAFLPPAAAPGTTHKKIRALPMQRHIAIDLTSGEMVYTLKSDGGEFDGASLAHLEEIDLDLGYSMLKRYRILDPDPLSAQTEFNQRALLRRGDWSVEISFRSRLTATADVFQFSGELEAFENGVEAAHKQWNIAIPRQLL